MRILGTVLLIITCIALGAGTDYFDRAGVTLVSEFEPKLGGVYDK